MTKGERYLLVGPGRPGVAELLLEVRVTIQIAGPVAILLAVVVLSGASVYGCSAVLERWGRWKRRRWRCHVGGVAVDGITVGGSVEAALGVAIGLFHRLVLGNRSGVLVVAGAPPLIPKRDVLVSLAGFAASLKPSAAMITRLLWAETEVSLACHQEGQSRSG